MVSVGEGGIIITDNESLYKTLLEVTSPGSFSKPDESGELDFSGFGLNLRMSPFSAIAANNLLARCASFVEDRQAAVNVLVDILKDHPTKFELVEIPEYANQISWYSYKLRLLDTDLEALKSKKYWKFSSFGYPAIADHEYWIKSSDYFPFCSNIKPIIRHELTGHNQYLPNRVTLNIPTVPASYWTVSNIAKWREALTF
jgi:hypothetical protein